MTLLAATDISLGDRLRPTNLTIGAGELVCLVGPNGSGKTSLLHALAGIGSPAGAVRIDGIDPTPLAPAQRQRLFSYLPAARDIKWPLLVSDMLQLGLPKDADFGAVERELELEPFLARRVDRLSTGERSRVLTARSLALNPKALLLDEPVANLDPLWQLKLMDILARRASAGETSALVALHDLDLAYRYADRLIVMQEGRIFADGPPERIFSGGHIGDVFGIERRDGRWQPL